MAGTASITRTIHYLIEPQNGESAVGFSCTQSKVSYPTTEAYTTKVYIYTNEGSNPVRPFIQNFLIAWAADPDTWHEVLPNTPYNNMRLNLGYEGNVVVATLRFDKGAAFKGTLKVMLIYNGAPFTQTIDVYPEPCPVYVECDIQSLTYNPKAASSQQFGLRLNVDGQSVVPIYKVYFREEGGNVQAYPALPFQTVVHEGVSISTVPSSGTWTVHFNEGATYEGALIFELEREGYTRTLTIPVTRVEDGDDAITLTPSCSSVVYNTYYDYTKIITFTFTQGEQEQKAASVSVRYRGLVNAGVELQDGDVLEGMAVGIKYATSNHPYARLILDFVADETAFEGELEITAAYKGAQRTVTVSVTRVADGEPGGIGPQGPRGNRGAIVRGPRLWTDVKTGNTDPSEKFYVGNDGEPYADLVLCINSDNQERYFTPKASHYVDESPYPLDDGAGEYWRAASNSPLVATEVLFAKKAKIKNLVVDEVLITQPREDNPNEEDVKFAAYYDKVRGKTVVYAGEGVFENVAVNGDINCNTQTFVLPTFEDDIPLWDTPYDEEEEEVVISVTPNGGCMVIPTGQCDYEIVLPPVAVGTARHVILINQNLPRRRVDGTTWQRSMYLRPMDNPTNNEGKDVVLFHRPDACSVDKITLSGEDTLLLPYGVYYLYGYSAELPNLNRNEDGHKRYTCWTLFSPSANDFTPTPRALEPFNYRGNGKTLDMYRQPTLGDLLEPSPIG